jgi:hypothetical protein
MSAINPTFSWTLKESNASATPDGPSVSETWIGPRTGYATWVAPYTIGKAHGTYTAAVLIGINYEPDPRGVIATATLLILR